MAMPPPAEVRHGRRLRPTATQRRWLCFPASSQHAPCRRAAGAMSPQVAVSRRANPAVEVTGQSTSIAAVARARGTLPSVASRELATGRKGAARCVGERRRLAVLKAEFVRGLGPLARRAIVDLAVLSRQASNH